MNSNKITTQSPLYASNTKLEIKQRLATIRQVQFVRNGELLLVQQSGQSGGEQQTRRYLCALWLSEGQQEKQQTNKHCNTGYTKVTCAGTANDKMYKNRQILPLDKTCCGKAGEV